MDHGNTAVLVNGHKHTHLESGMGPPRWIGPSELLLLKSHALVRPKIIQPDMLRSGGVFCGDSSPMHAEGDGICTPCGDLFMRHPAMGSIHRQITPHWKQYSMPIWT